MANSHPGSYCGQDAYNDMFVTEVRDDLRTTGIWSLQGIEVGISAQNEGLERCHRPCNQMWGGVKTTWKIRIKKLFAWAARKAMPGSVRME